MSIVRPFRGIRPVPEAAASIAALPYDVYDSAEAREEVKKEPLSFLKIDRAETQFPEGTDMYSRKVYDKARDTLYKALSEGLFVQDSRPCYYIYALTMNGHTQTGLVGCASIDDYQNGVILRHENTLEEKELDRIRHVDTLSAQTGPIFLAYRPRPELKAITERSMQTPALYDFISPDGVRHQVWKIDSAEDIENISQTFSSIPHLYIADGHHRAASAVKVGLKRRSEDTGFCGSEEYNYFLSVLFPSDELRIYDYNRVVSDMNGYTFDKLIAMIKNEFEVTDIGTQARHPEKKGEICMYFGRRWYLLRAKPALYTEDPVKSLDVSVLQDTILGPLLGIRNPKADPRIRFVGGIRGLKTLEEYADTCGGIAFAMYPTTMDELLEVADAGLLMPPKSTWFEPKLRSGLFIHQF